MPAGGGSGKALGGDETATTVDGIRRSVGLGLPESRIYLNSAAEGLPLHTAPEALLAALDAKRLGTRGRDALFAGETACREAVARLIGASTEEVALVPDVSSGIERFVQAVPWREGDEVLLNDLEFPSNVSPWLFARDKYGIRVRVLPTRRGVLDPQDVEQAITARTRMLSVSAVSFKSGGRFDLAALAAVARAHGVMVGVDATQALGVTNVPAGTWDVLWSSGYKWLLGVHGIAVMAIRSGMLADVPHGTPGWRATPVPFPDDRFERISWSADATRFHAGMPSFPSIFVLHDALETLQSVGVNRIAAHVRDLGTRLLTGLQALGIRCLTPMAAEERAGIVAFETPAFAVIAEQLSARNIDVWAKDGRVRISFHAYTSDADVDACLGALECVLREAT